ncbi:hypothetical protein BD408DRAFT_440016 [Parasitella parasitica]|nr:hypothetical protein BD408DRAFT_440016 [Parasitella parasitica]
MGLLDANTKNVRLDFIFTNSSGLNDAFYCEDKPNERASKDIKKTRYLREQALNYWVSLLPYNECIEHITAVTCQFNKLTLQIAATKFIAGVTVSSVLREVRIPNNDQEGASVADYLATVISLVGESRGRKQKSGRKQEQNDEEAICEEFSGAESDTKYCDRNEISAVARNQTNSLEYEG